MMTKTCDVTGKPMAPTDLDFAEASNVFTIKEKDGSQGKLSLHVRVAQNGQFPESIHVSREGMEQLMVEAAENLPSKAPATKVPAKPVALATTKTAEAPDSTPPPTETTGKTLKRDA